MDIRDSKLWTSRGGRSRVGMSDPSTRTSSLSRTSDSRFLYDGSRSKTLERPTRSACPTPFVSEKEDGNGYSTRSLSRPVKRKQCLSALPPNTSLSHSVNCPPLENQGSCSPEVVAPSVHDFNVVTRIPAIHSSPSAEECISYDSGFSYDQDESDNQSYIFQHLRDTQTNSRLNALESSLMNLLDQINGRERMASTCPAGGLPTVSKLDVESEIPNTDAAHAWTHQFSSSKRSSIASLLNKPSENKSTHSRYHPSGTIHRISVDASQLPNSGGLQINKQGSAPGSLNSSRKSSSDRKTGEYYLKKIQNNFSKWYWK